MGSVEELRQQSEDYQALLDYGFSSAKAHEIALDAKRGDAYAKQFVELARLAPKK